MEDNYNGQLIYSESLDRKSLNGIKGFLLIVGLVFGCLLLILLVGFIQYITGIGYLQFILLVAVLISCFFIVKHFLTKYDYVVLKDSVCMIRAIGKREKLIAQFSFSDIVYIGKNNADAKPLFVGRKREKATYKSINSDSDCIVTKDSYIFFNSTDKFIKAIEDNR